jgi:hypothetical protein
LQITISIIAKRGQIIIVIAHNIGTELISVDLSRDLSTNCTSWSATARGEKIAYILLQGVDVVVFGSNFAGGRDETTTLHLF